MQSIQSSRFSEIGIWIRYLRDYIPKRSSSDLTGERGNLMEPSRVFSEAQIYSIRVNGYPFWKLLNETAEELTQSSCPGS